MRLKNTADNFSASFHITPPYQMVVIHSSKLIYPRELYQRGIQRKRVELIAKDFNEYTANEPKVSFRNGRYYVVIGNTITDPATAYDDRGLLPAGPQNRIWYMPFFSTDVWYMRRQIAQMNLLFEPKGEPAKIEKSDIKPANLQKSIKNEPKAPENEPLNETKTGQLTFF